jgi:hypothetical protein
VDVIAEILLTWSTLAIPSFSWRTVTISYVQRFWFLLLLLLLLLLLVVVVVVVTINAYYYIRTTRA